MTTKKDLIKQVALRLRVVMEETDLKTVDDLATLLEASRSRTSNWLNGYHLIPVEYAIRLKRKTNIGLEWLYDEDPAALTHATAIRLTAAMERTRLQDPPEPASAI